MRICVTAEAYGDFSCFATSLALLPFLGLSLFGHSGYSPWNDGERKLKCSVYCTGFSKVWVSIITKERKMVMDRLTLLMEL